MAHHLRQQLDRVGLDDELVVVGREALGDEPGARQLVELAAGEADREGPDRGRGLLGHRRDDRRGVDAAGEEGADRHFGDEAATNRGVLRNGTAVTLRVPALITDRTWEL